MNFKTVFSVLGMCLIQSCIKKKYVFCFLSSNSDFFPVRASNSTHKAYFFYHHHLDLLRILAPISRSCDKIFASLSLSLLSLINKIWIASINFISNEYEQFMNGLKHCCARFVCTTNLLYNIHHIVRVLVNSSNHFYNQMNNEHMYQLF